MPPRQYNANLHHKAHEVDVCVIGGGMAGLCAALAAARRGARTAIMHDRPMFGGNASSEVRMWICGAHGRHNKETGILEELQLENLHQNPAGNYPVWDHVMHGKVLAQPNLTLLLNCSCLDAEATAPDADRPGRITSVTGWQLTTQTFHTVEAKHFVDCSGDSILAPLSGAACRWGRESADQFDEDIEPPTADRRTMGSSLLIQLRRTDAPQPFTPPSWAYKFTEESEFAHRMKGVNAHNFWWVEVGGIDDTIHDAERIRDELMKISYGVWDYIKNRSPEKHKAAQWELYWIGRLPGKRENRRYVGDHTLTQRDIEAGGRFEDTVAYGGWTMDDHHPAGMLYPGKPTIHHAAPSPYGIAYRCLYSRNVNNLLFAGRNISVTHAALSSTRVMGTCAVIGQAAGTAAALAVKHGVGPRGIHQHHLHELQQTLMDDDCFLPGFTRAASDIAQTARITGEGEGLNWLTDGRDRDREGQPNAWVARPGDAAAFHWDQPTSVGMLRCTFDSNLDNDKRMPCAYPLRADRCAMPGSLVRSFRVDVLDDRGRWVLAARVADNRYRVARVKVGRRTRGVRLVPESTWGDEAVRIFAIEPARTYADLVPPMLEGEAFAQVRARQNAADLAEPTKDPAREKQPAHSA